MGVQFLHKSRDWIDFLYVCVLTLGYMDLIGTLKGNYKKTTGKPIKWIICF